MLTKKLLLPKRARLQQNRRNLEKRNIMIVALFAQPSTETQATPPAAKIFPGSVNSVGGSSSRELAWSKVLEEFHLSAVSPTLTKANVEILAGDKLLQELTQHAVAELGGHSQQYVTAEVKKIFQKYKSVVEGGAWLCYGQTLAGEQGDVPVIKPFRPRTITAGTGFGVKEKVLKYETPLKAPGTPILPIIPEDFVSRIEGRWGVQLRRDIPIWRAIQEVPTVPVAITEGVKKALSLVEQGIPAIAIRGVTMWRLTGSDQLAPELAAFGQKGRRIFLFFDQDEKPKTRKQVFNQAFKIGKEFERLSCDFRIVDWDFQLGKKGIDDVLVSIKSGERWDWLSGLLESAPTLGRFKNKQFSSISLERVRQAQDISSYFIERETCGEYLPQLPPLEEGIIHALSAPTGSGKSTRIGADWIKPWVTKPNHLVIVLSPLNSLGQQAAQQWGIPHVHEFPNTPDGQRFLEWAMEEKRGIILCADSMHRLPNWIWEKDILLVLDEANQVVNHIIRGNTLGSRWGAVNEAFAKLLLVSNAIIAAEANLLRYTLRFLKSVSQKELKLFKHTNSNRTPWPVFFYTGHSSHVSGFFADLLEHLIKGEKIAFFSSSKFAGKRLEALVNQIYPGLRIERIDSDTNDGIQYSEFFETPDQWLQKVQPDLLICSPTAKTGLSIQGGIPVSGAYFQSVWGYFPCGTGDVHYQMLSRFRPPVPRFIYCAEQIFSESDDDAFSANSIKKNLKQDILILAQALGMAGMLENDDPWIEQVQDAIFNFYCQSMANSAAQKRASVQYLMYLLAQDGHQISYLPLRPNAGTKEALLKAKETVLNQEAQDIANAQITSNMDAEWANKILHSQASYKVVCQARKVLLKDEFPGVNFNDVNICRKAVVENYGAMLRGVRLQAYAEDLESVQRLDSERLRHLLESPLKALHKMPKNLMAANLIVELGVLNLIGKPYSASTEEVLQIKEKAVLYRALIWRYLRLNVLPDQPPVHVVNKLLRRLGIHPKATTRPGSKDRERIYEAAPDEVHVQLLAALKRNLRRPRPPFSSIGVKGRVNLGRPVSTNPQPTSSSSTSRVQEPNPPPPNLPPKA